MRRLIKFLFQLTLFLAIGFAIYALFADLPAPVEPRAVPVPLPAQGQ